MFLDAMSGIVADIPDAVERHIKQIGTYVEQAASGLGGWVAHNPNEFIIACSAAATAVFTFVLATKTAGLFRETSGLRESTDRLWAAGERQLELIEENAQRQSHEMQTTIGIALGANDIAITNAQQQLRAYVTVQEVSVHTHRGPSRVGTMVNQIIEGPVLTYRLSVILKNGGVTPAVNAKININNQRFPGAIPDDFNFPDSVTFGDALIGPQTVWFTPPILIAASDMERLIAPATHYLWGWIEYDDIFQGAARHRTEFCFQIMFERLQPMNEPWLAFLGHSRFNAADGDCLRPIDPNTNKSEPG